MANNNNEIMTFQNKDNLQKLLTDAENRFDKKYLTPENGYYRALQLMGAPYIEEVKPDDDDFGDNKGSVVSTTAGSDNFHAEGEAINPDAFIDHDLPQITDYPYSDRFSQDSPYYNNFKPVTQPIGGLPQVLAPKVADAIRQADYNKNIDDDSLVDSNDSLDIGDIGKSIFDIDTDSDVDSLKTENVRIVEPKSKQVKQPDVSVEDVEVKEEPPMKPVSKEAVIEDMDYDNNMELLKEYKKNVAKLSADKHIHAHSLLKDIGISNDEGWSKANYNERKKIVSQMLRKWDAQKKK
jgi:hypothetical protein